MNSQKPLSLITTVLISLLVFACQKDDLSNDDSFNEQINSYEEYIYNDSDLSDYIYDQNKLHRFDIFISQENLDILNNDPVAEEYVEGSLVFEGKIISNVGIRYKGSIGAWVGCLSNIDFSNPSGYKTCPKLSMKIKINSLEDRKFYGMNKLQFHSQNLDPSKMHERLGYYLYRNFGVATARSNHALIYINGEFNGVFANTENIDGPFTNTHFNNKGGNLYKEVWPVNSQGESQDSNYFIDGLKTNEELSNVSIIQNFSNQLSGIDNSDAWSIVENWIDKEIFLKTLVVDRRIANDDGFLHFYPQENGLYENHNYYWYEQPNQNKLQLIPWDLDNAFENLIVVANPVTPIKDRWYETSNACEGFNYGAFNLLQKSAACDKIIGSFTDFRDVYNELDALFKDDLYNMPNINSLIDTWSNQISEAVEEANKIHGEKEPSLEAWTRSVDNLKNSINFSLNLE